jgi:hypothetical protein
VRVSVVLPMRAEHVLTAHAQGDLVERSVPLLMGSPSGEAAGQMRDAERPLGRVTGASATEVPHEPDGAPVYRAEVGLELNDEDPAVVHALEGLRDRSLGIGLDAAVRVDRDRSENYPSRVGAPGRRVVIAEVLRVRALAVVPREPTADSGIVELREG